MSSNKIHCSDCNINITRKHYDRHFKSQKHIKNSNIKLKELNVLKDWAGSNQIHNLHELTKDQLEELRSTFRDRKNDYNIFNDEKLRNIVNRLSIRNIDKLNREQLINRLNKIKSKPSRLGLRSTKYIKELAEKKSIDITNKSRNELIDEIYNKTINSKDKSSVYYSDRRKNV